MSRKQRKKHYSRSEREQLKERAQAAEAKRRLARIPVAVDGPAGQAPGTWQSHRSDPQRMVDSDCWMIGPDLRQRLVSIYQVAMDRRPGLTDLPYSDGLHRLGQESWLREPAAWRPDGRGLTAAFRSLAGHLLGRYRISPWLWDTLLTDHWRESVPREAIRFLAAYAGGRSVRTLAGTKILPAQLTRRMCHLLTTPPHRMGFVSMVRRAQVLGCGGTEQLAQSLHLMELCRFKCNESYWADVIHWLCRQDLPDRPTIKAIVEYLDERECCDEPVAIHGRTWRSVLRDAERLQREEARCLFDRQPRRLAAAATPKSRPCADLAGFTASEWTIARIQSARKLVLEGAAMRHCVATYRPDMAAGTSSFWSLTCGGNRRLTIEVRTAEMKIAAIGGKANRLPRPDEMRQVQEWAQKSGLALDRVLFEG